MSESDREKLRSVGTADAVAGEKAPEKIHWESRDHVRSVAVALAKLQRLEAELSVVKANVKLAEAELQMAVRRCRTYAETQMGFAFEVPA